MITSASTSGKEYFRIFKAIVKILLKKLPMVTASGTFSFQGNKQQEYVEEVGDDHPHLWLHLNLWQRVFTLGIKVGNDQ